MLSDDFEPPWRLARMRAICVGPYVEAFSTTLAETLYSPFTIRGYLRAADHVGRWTERSGRSAKTRSQTGQCSRDVCVS